MLTHPLTFRHRDGTVGTEAAMIKITLTAERKILALALDNFNITFNGLENTAYKAALAPLGVSLEFVAEAESAEALTKEDSK